MQQATEQQWFFRELTKSAFFIYAVTWFILLVLEMIKPGLVTNYFSLTHSVLPLIVLGVLWLVLLPSEEIQVSSEKQSFPYVLLLILSAIIVGLVLATIQASFALTVLIIFAILAALWGGVYSFWNQSN